MREKMRKLCVVLAGLCLLLALLGCNYKEAETSEKRGAFKVERLFTHDGITMYRFEDGGRSIYFASQGRVEWSEMHGKVSAHVGVDTVGRGRMGNEGV